MAHHHVATLALVLALTTAPVVLAGGEQVSFELPDMQGVERSRSDFDSRYVLFVYQGMP